MFSPGAASPAPSVWRGTALPRANVYHSDRFYRVWAVPFHKIGTGSSHRDRPRIYCSQIHFVGCMLTHTQLLEELPTQFYDESFDAIRHTVDSVDFIQEQQSISTSRSRKFQELSAVCVAVERTAQI
jgi:hypothetical protein